MKKIFFLTICLFFCTSVILLANKTSVEIKAPSEVKKGSEIILVIEVFHKGNKKIHHTDWVYLKINGKEVKRWVYTKDNLPASENFKIEYKMVFNEEVIIEAEGNCNIHGSDGVKKVTIKSK